MGRLGDLGLENRILYNFCFGLVEINVVIITIIVQLTDDFHPSLSFTANTSDITGMYEFS
jgi:hypothetical protein